MSRLPRVHEPDSIHHVTSRGVEKRDIFLVDRDRIVFLGYLKDAVRDAQASLLSYCLMTNHFHLLIAVRDVSLSDIMHQLLTRFSLYFNRSYGRVGHLFQGRYWDERCLDLGYLIHLPVYIHRNPVRAGLAMTVADWQWSSHRELATGEGGFLDLSRLEELADMPPGEFRQRYLERAATVGLDEEDCRNAEQMLRRIARTHAVDLEELFLGRRGSRYGRVKSELISWARGRGIGDEEVARALRCTREAVRQLRSRYCHNRA